MKAITCDRYGPPEVLQFEELAKPVPGDNEVLIRTHATTVTSGDWRARSLSMPPGFGLIARLIFGIRGPRQRVLGGELAGEVESVGKDVTSFQAGDRVFVFTGAKLGCYVEYMRIPEDGKIVRMPDNLTFGEAAALSFGGTTALDFFRKGQLQQGERVLINGASGGVGTTAVQLARHFGAHVTGVCSGRNTELVRSLGADKVIDYTQQDFAELDARYDIIMDTVGTAPWSKSRRSLSDDGRLLCVLGSMSDLLRAPLVALTSQRKIIAGPAAERLDDLHLLAELASCGALKPVIDRQYPIDQIVEAHRFVDTGRKAGNVVIQWTTE